MAKISTDGWGVSLDLTPNINYKYNYQGETLIKIKL